MGDDGGSKIVLVGGSKFDRNNVNNIISRGQQGLVDKHEYKTISISFSTGLCKISVITIILGSAHLKCALHEKDAVSNNSTKQIEGCLLRGFDELIR